MKITTTATIREVDQMLAIGVGEFAPTANGIQRVQAGLSSDSKDAASVTTGVPTPFEMFLALAGLSSSLPAGLAQTQIPQSASPNESNVATTERLTPATPQTLPFTAPVPVSRENDARPEGATIPRPSGFIAVTNCPSLSGVQEFIEPSSPLPPQPQSESTSVQNAPVQASPLEPLRTSEVMKPQSAAEPFMVNQNSTDETHRAIQPTGTIIEPMPAELNTHSILLPTQTAAHEVVVSDSLAASIQSLQPSGAPKGNQPVSNLNDAPPPSQADKVREKVDAQPRFDELGDLEQKRPVTEQPDRELQHLWPVDVQPHETQAAFVNVEATSETTPETIATQAAGETGKEAPRPKSSSETVRHRTFEPSSPVAALTNSHLHSVRPSSSSAGPVADQIASAVAHRLEAEPASGPVTLRIRLDPPELGQVNLHLSVVHDVVSIKLVAFDESTRQLIDRQMDDLRQSLTNNGVALAQCHVECDTRGQNPSDQRDQFVPQCYPDTAVSPRITRLHELVRPVIPELSRGGLNYVA